MSNPPTYESIFKNDNTLTQDELPNYENEESKSFIDEKNDKKQLGTSKGLRIHYLTGKETLAGLALRYGVKKEVIRRANHMATDHLAGYAKLFIPDTNVEAPELTEEQKQRRYQEKMLKRFQLITKCHEIEEARFYLLDAEWNVEHAIEKYFSDVEWDMYEGKNISKKEFSVKF